MAMFKPLLMSTVLLVSLSACESMPWKEYNQGDPVRSVPSAEQKADLLAQARRTTLENKYPEIRSGQLDAAEEAYRNAPQNQDTALAYARLLRHVNMVEQADMVLKPFAENTDMASEELLVEYSKLKLTMGQMDQAQMMAQEAGFKGNSPSSLMILGVALDAQGHHVAAEQQFRAALQGVGMDIDLRNKILNNLAVSLMGQGRKDEAQSVLAQIRDSAGSGNTVIEANRKLAETL